MCSFSVQKRQEMATVEQAELVSQLYTSTLTSACEYIIDLIADLGSVYDGYRCIRTCQVQFTKLQT